MNRYPLGLLFSIAFLACQATSAAGHSFRARPPEATPAAPTATAEDLRSEIVFGRDVAARVLGRYRVTGDERQNVYASLVGRAMAANGERSELVFHFAVLDTDTINAYAAPGGYIFVTRGAIGAMQDEAELAAVLAHEVAHVNRRHIVKELRIRGTDAAPEAGVAHLLGGFSDPTRVAFTRAVDHAVNLLFESGLKQDDELEADRVATMMLAQSGYDPTALRRYLARLQDRRDGPTAILNKTHPSFDTRIATLDRLLGAEQLRESAARAKKRFDIRTK